MRKTLIAFGVFVLACVVLWLLWEYGIKAGIRESVRAEIAVAGHDSTEAALKPVSDSLRVQYIEQKVPYVVYRDRIIQANPKDTVIRNLANKCDQLILTCEERQRVDSARISNLQAEVKTLKELKKKPEARVSAFITGGMDFIASQPLIQAGGEVRFIGPLHLTGFVQAARLNNENEVQTRGVIALRFNFR